MNRAGVKAPRSARPNVIFVTTDHQRYDCVGANGNPWIHTPTLDRLANEGVSLERCYVQNPVCMPSRASIWTGRYPQNHRVTTNGITLPRGEKTMAHVFQESGYRTANIGKLHFLPHYGRDHTQNDFMYAGYGYEMNLLSDEPGCYPDAYMEWVEKNASQHIDALRVPEPRGARGHFDEWVLQAPEEYSHSAWIAHEACNFLRAYSDPRPFFLSLGFYAPHPPLNPPNQYVELYNPADLPLPVQHPSEMERNRYRDVTLEEWQRAKMFFYAMCSVVDHYVAQIMDTLKATGFGDDTLVVFMSDHGDALGDHGQLGKGPSNYESIVRVPCLLWHPSRIPAGRRVPALIESIDIFPALGDYCALKMPAGVKGVNIKPLIQGETEEGRDDILIEFKDPRRGFSVKTLRSTEYKYFRYHDGREVLYDLGENDEEVFDKSKDQAYQGTIQEMRGRLLNRLINAEDDLPERTHDY